MSLFSGCVFFWGKQKIAYPEAHGLFAGQKPPEAALAADKTSVVSAAKKAATPDISIPSTTPRGRLRRPRGVVDPIEMSDVATFLAADTTEARLQPMLPTAVSVLRTNMFFRLFGHLVGVG